MGITLMAHIPYYFVPWKVENIVKDSGQLYHTQARSEVSSGF